MASKYDELEKLRALHAQGTLTDSEFKGEKEKLLYGNAKKKSIVEKLDDNRSYNTLMHLSQFSNYLFPLLGIIVPIVMWVTRKDESKSVDTNGKIILNWNISVFIYAIISVLLLVIAALIFGGTMALSGIEFENFLEESPWMIIQFLGTLGVILLPLIIIGILDFIFTIIGAVKASNNEVWNYPLSIRFFKTPPSTHKIKKAD